MATSDGTEPLGGDEPDPEHSDKNQEFLQDVNGSRPIGRRLPVGLPLEANADGPKCAPRTIRRTGLSSGWHE